MIKTLARSCMACIALLLAGCDWIAPAQPLVTPAPTGAASRSGQVIEPANGLITIYLPRLLEDDSLGLQAAIRPAPPTDEPARAALEALIGGPNGDERAADYHYALDRRTRILSLRVAEGTASVEFTQEIRRVRGRPFSELVYWSIVYTLTEVPGVERVSLLQGGEPMARFGYPPIAIPVTAGRGDAPSWVTPARVARAALLTENRDSQLCCV